MKDFLKFFEEVGLSRGSGSSYVVRARGVLSRCLGYLYDLHSTTLFLLKVVKELWSCFKFLELQAARE
jgi:hypothetical protein